MITSTKVQGISFKGININKLKPLHAIYLPSIDSMEKLTEGVDVFLKSTVKKFPYKGKKSFLWECDTIEISARPKNLGFIERLFGKKTQREYYPIGNISDMIDYPKPPFEELLKTLVAKVK